MSMAIVAIIISILSLCVTGVSMYYNRKATAANRRAQESLARLRKLRGE